MAAKLISQGNTGTRRDVESPYRRPSLWLRIPEPQRDSSAPQQYLAAGAAPDPEEARASEVGNARLPSSPVQFLGRARCAGGGNQAVAGPRQRTDDPPLYAPSTRIPQRNLAKIPSIFAVQNEPKPGLLVPNSPKTEVERKEKIA